MKIKGKKKILDVKDGLAGLLIITAAVSYICAGQVSESLDPVELICDRISTSVNSQKTKLPEPAPAQNSSITIVPVKLESNADQNTAEFSRAEASPPSPDFEKEIKVKILDSSISPIKEYKKDLEGSGLQEMISKINSINFEHKALVNQHLTTEEENSESEQKNVQQVGQEAEPQEPSVKVPSSAVGPQDGAAISSQTLEIIKQAAAEPSKVECPEELAEIMFLSGNYQEAADFYREAYSRMNVLENKSEEEMSWLLFQLGNCLKKSDPNEAVITYRQLILQYPRSSWTEAAKAQENLTQWSQKELKDIKKIKK